ncbi:MAG TPA: DUF2760 domain-containing protein [Chthoniobacterales bacterium]
MGNFLLGFQAMFRIWSDNDFAAKVEKLAAGEALEAPKEPKAEPRPVEMPKAVPAAPPAPRRSEAITLLAVLQRDARLVDFLQEPIDSYSDAQIGSAVRGIHKDSAAVLQRLFALKLLREENEGAPVQVPAGFDSAKIRLSGNVAGSGPYRGTLAHPGWVATKCELPEWTGRDDAALVVAPAEVEVK